MTCLFKVSRENSLPTHVIPENHILATIQTNLTLPLRKQILTAKTMAPAEKSSNIVNFLYLRIYNLNCWEASIILKLQVTLKKVNHLGPFLASCSGYF